MGNNDLGASQKHNVEQNPRKRNDVLLRACTHLR